MKQFFLKVILFMGCYIALTAVIRLVYKPHYAWGNDYFLQKLQATGENKHNCYFLGSSRIYRQVVPSLFDSLCNIQLPEKNIHSFNMGCPATFPPELFMLSENFARSQPGIKYLFVELNENAVFDKNIFTIKGNYWMSLNEFFFSLKLKLQSKEPERLRNIVYLGEGWLQHILTIRAISNRTQAPAFGLGPRNDGFYPLELEWEKEGNKTLWKNREALLKDTTVLMKRSLSMERMLKNKNKADLNLVAVKRLYEFLKICEQKNIYALFVLTPRKLNSDLVECFNSLPEKNKINLCDPVRYPEFYQMKFSFDAGHLNTHGAYEFTKALFSEFVLKINS